MSSETNGRRNNWIKPTQLKDAMRNLKNVRVTAEQPKIDSLCHSMESPKVRRALLPSNKLLRSSRQVQSHNSLLGKVINQPEASNGSSRILHSMQTRSMQVTQYQQRREGDADVFDEEQNHDMLNVEEDGRTSAPEDTITITTKTRGCNKLKTPKEPIYISVNSLGQPDCDEARKLSSFIGILARDPRKMPIDCIDFRKFGEDRIEHIWNIVQGSFKFPEGRQPKQWFRETLDASWRWNKCKLKRHKFNGKSIEDALDAKPEIIPEDQWRNVVEFWASDVGQHRSVKNSDNRANYEMSHYGGSKSFARLRREMTKDGKEPDKLELFEVTHKPKRAKTKLDDASAATLVKIQTALDKLPESSREDPALRDKIYEDIVGEDKNGYAKTYGLGVRVPWSQEKRCALAKERERRIKAEEDLKNMTVKLHSTEEVAQRAAQRAERALNWVGKVMKDLLSFKSKLRSGEYEISQEEASDRSFLEKFMADNPTCEFMEEEDELMEEDINEHDHYE